MEDAVDTAVVDTVVADTAAAGIVAAVAVADDDDEVVEVVVDAFVDPRLSWTTTAH